MTPPGTPHILIVEDEPGVRLFLQDALEAEGYQIFTAEHPKQAFEQARQHPIDLAILDLHMPDMDGMTVLARLRAEHPEMRAIILTAHATIESAVEAIRFAADDYLIKPCKINELRQSVRASLEKRQQKVRQRSLLESYEQRFTETRPAQSVHPNQPGADANSAGEEAADQMTIGGLTLNLPQHTAYYEGRSLGLSATEFDVLACLAEKYPQVVSSQELAAQALNYQVEAWEAANLLRYHIYRIRQKIQQLGGPADIVRTVRGLGYTLAQPVDS